MIYLFAKGNFKNVKSIELAHIVFLKLEISLNDFELCLATSKNALKALQKNKIPIPANLRLYSFEKSLKFAKNLGFKEIKIPSKSYGKNLVAEFKEEFRGKKVLYLRGEKIAFDMKNELAKEQIYIEENVVYKNEFALPKTLPSFMKDDILIFTSPNTTSFFLKHCKFNKEAKFVAIGQSTALRLKNFRNVFVAENTSIKSCVKLARSL